MRRSVRLEMIAVVMLVLSLAAGCRSDEAEAPEADESRRDATPRRHLFAPPPGEVREVPPHAIRSAGVGPYRLGASLEEILGNLPHAPRVELLQIHDLLDYSLVRIESDAIIIGVERFEGVTFVAVLDRDIARAEEGVGVGTHERNLREAMGRAAPAPDRIADPRLLSFSVLPNTHFVVERERVVAVVVRDGPDPAGLPGEAEESREPRCEDEGRFDGADEGEIAEAARIDPGAADDLLVERGCFGGARAKLIATAGDRIAVIGGEAGELRRRASIGLRGLVYAAPLDVTGDGSDEIAAVVSRRQGDRLEIDVAIIDLVEGDLSVVARETPLALSSRWATWVGADLDDTEFLIEVEASGGVLEIAGLYLHRDGREIRQIAPIQARTWAPESLPLPRRDPGATAPRDAGAAGEGEGESEAEADGDAAPPADADGATPPP